MIKFELNEVEEKKAESFKKWHKRCRPNKNNDTIPQYAPFKYVLTPLGIGTAIEIICPYCGKKKDITDIDSW